VDNSKTKPLLQWLEGTARAAATDRAELTGPSVMAAAYADIQAVAIGGAYGADHYHDDVPGWRWRGGLLVVMAVIALAVLAGTFAYRAVFGGYDSLRPHRSSAPGPTTSSGIIAIPSGAIRAKRP
jgi:hypothetical protein